MKAIKEEFPNPVLAAGRDDYIDACRFNTSFEEGEIVVDSDNISIPINYQLECQGLSSLIKSGDAVAVVLVKSSAASYSKLFRFTDDLSAMTISVPKFAIVNKMDVTGSIIAAHDIPAFRCEGEFNDMYFGSATFEIRKGDILATEESRTIFVDNSELEKPISSIFDISKREEQDSDVVPSFYGEKIEIYLKRELYDLYYNFKDFNNGALRKYATGIIVYPVLVEAVKYVIGYYQNSDDEEFDFSEKRWFRAIVHKIEKKDVDLSKYDESPTTLADNLLGGISLAALHSFKETLDSEINNDEIQMIGGID